MSASKHTPLPWKTHTAGGSWTPLTSLGSRWLSGPDGVVIASSVPLPDADFIVLAVNSHAALLEALEAIAAAKAVPVDTGHTAATLLVVAKDEYDYVRDIARAALAAAREAAK